MILRHFAPDHLRARSAMTDDQRAHPVVAAIRRRRDEGSRPGERTDGRRIALVIEGGGMRGVVSAGMAAAIEQLGLRDAFDEIHGASAGAFNAAFLLAGQAGYLTALYPHGFGDPHFVSLRRALRGGALFDMDFVVDQVWRAQRPLRLHRILSGPIELHCTATDVDSAEVVDLAGLRDEHEVSCALRASARLPWLAGPPITFRGRRLLDATLAESIPVRAPRHTATDLLVLQTRPQGVSHGGMSGPVARLTDRYLARLNPALVELRRTRTERYDRLSAELAAQSADPSAAPRVCVVRPPADALLVGHLENRLTVLAVAAAQGMRAAWMALEGEDPELLSTPVAYPEHPPAQPPATRPQQAPVAVGERGAA